MNSGAHSMTPFRRTTATLVALCMAGTTVVSTAQAATIGTDQVARAQAHDGAGEGRTRLLTALDRTDVVAALQAHGVDAAAARVRVAALTDAEAEALAAQIDSAPAGGDVLGVLVFIFVLLLVTDILGLTKVFPFTRPVH
jgi:hypothetical protein